MQDAILRDIDDPAGEVSSKKNAATKLMVQGYFEAAIKAWEKIAVQHPEELGLCESQIGAGYFFLNQFETAIEYYKKALEHGADPHMMRDNIEEAEEAIREREGKS